MITATAQLINPDDHEMAITLKMSIRSWGKISEAIRHSEQEAVSENAPIYTFWPVRSVIGNWPSRRMPLVTKVHQEQA